MDTYAISDLALLICEGWIPEAPVRQAVYANASGCRSLSYRQTALKCLKVKVLTPKRTFIWSREWRVVATAHPR